MNLPADKPSLLRRIVLGSNVRATFRRGALLALLTFIATQYVIMPVRPQGLSMAPNYRDGSLHFASLLRYAWTPPQRGDVVLIAMAAGRHAVYLKRVVGLPGERIAFRNGDLLINGKLIPEPYIVYTGRWTMPEMTIPDGEYFVAGDNRALPLDWHTLGTVERERIVGGIAF